MKLKESKDYKRQIEEHVNKHGIEPDLIFAVTIDENGVDENGDPIAHLDFIKIPISEIDNYEIDLKWHRYNSNIPYVKKIDYVVKEDMICPITKQHCDDECCTVGSECNISGDDLQPE